MNKEQELMNRIVAKIYQQWKTIRKAFADMNKDTGSAGALT